MHDDFTKLVDIQTFQQRLVTEFNTRNIIKIFRSKDVPEQKQPNVNNSEVKDKKEASPFKEDFKKKKLDFLKDWELAKELAESFAKFSNDSNKDTQVLQIPEVASSLKEKKQRICGECFSSNCQLLQHLSKIHKTTPKFAGRCKGKPVTMGSIKEVIKNVEKRISYLKNQKKTTPKPSENKKQLDGLTAVVKPNENNYSQDPKGFFYHNPDPLAPGGFAQNRDSAVAFGTFEVKISNLPKITSRTLPIWESMNTNRNYKCIICGKQKLHMTRYSEHMVFNHQVSLEDPILEEYKQARNHWIYERQESTEEELKTAN